MNKTNRILFLALAASASVLAAPAYAIDGTINFNGELTAETCDVSVNGATGGIPVNATVTLPTVSTSLLTAAGQTTGQTGFDIGLANCVGAASTARTFFNSGVTVNAAYRLSNQAAVAAATNVDLQLLDLTSNQVIQIGQNTQLTSTNNLVPITSGSATMRYAVQYYATGTTTAGNVGSFVTFNIDYQ